MDIAVLVPTENAKWHLAPQELGVTCGLFREVGKTHTVHVFVLGDHSIENKTQKFWQAINKTNLVVLAHQNPKKLPQIIDGLKPPYGIVELIYGTTPKEVKEAAKFVTYIPLPKQIAQLIEEV